MKKDRIRAGRAAAMAAALLVCAGCATKRDIRDLRAEIQALAVRQDSLLVALARQSMVTQDTLRRQTDQLFEIRGDVSRQLQRILDELARLGELTGQNQRSIASVRDQLDGLRRGPVAADPAPGGVGGEALVGGAPGSGGSADATYAIALQLYQRGQLETAQRAFRDFLEQNANHELAPHARFYLADILEQQGDADAALAAFDEIPELHPTSDRVPEALYRSALLEIEDGNRAEAGRLLDRVVNSYPDSNAAVLARDKLREIR